MGLACCSSPSFHPQRRPSLTHDGDATADSSASSNVSCLCGDSDFLVGLDQLIYAGWTQHLIHCHRTTARFEHVHRDSSLQLIESTAELNHRIPCRLRGAPSRSSEGRLCSLHSTKDFPFGTTYPDHLQPTHHQRTILQNNICEWTNTSTRYGACPRPGLSL